MTDPSSVFSASALCDSRMVIFSKHGYAEIITYARSKGYRIIKYSDIDAAAGDKCILYRHDVDLSLDRALEIADLEAQMGVKSTYFVLLATDHYNVGSIPSRKALKRLIDLGHDVGLHWDSRTYPENTEEAGLQFKAERDYLSTITGQPVRFASQHFPAHTPPLDLTQYVEMDSGSPVIRKRFKYVSDSSMAWREHTPLDLINQGVDFQFLSHPIWWTTGGANLTEKYDAHKAFDAVKRGEMIDEERDYILEYLKVRAQRDVEFRARYGQ